MSNKNNQYDLDKIYHFLNSPEYSPEKFVEIIAENFEEKLKKSAGVWEGYTVKQHTIMVLKQFEKYFSLNSLPAGINKNFFRIILAFHDIGKPEAIEEGDKRLQHKFTKKKITRIFERLGITVENENIALSLILGDPVGEYLKGFIDVKKAAEIIVKMAYKSGLQFKKFFELLMVYFKVDSGSYTEDAGGYRSLDHLFVFDRENGNMNFSPFVLEKIKRLKRYSEKLYKLDKI